MPYLTKRKVKKTSIPVIAECVLCGCRETGGSYLGKAVCSKCVLMLQEKY